MTPACIVLDLDGPILNGVERHYTVYREILIEKGFTALPRDEYWDLKRSLVDRRQILALTNAEEIYPEFLSTWLDRIEQRRYLRLDELQPRIADVLDAWRSRGITLFLATLRSNEANLLWQLQVLGLTQYFHQIVAVPHSDPGNGRRTSKAAHIRDLIGFAAPETVLWVGDTEVDIEAARELGVQSCAVLCGLRTESHLRAFSPSYVAKDVAELASMLS